MLLLFDLSGFAAGTQEAMMTKTPLDDFLTECLARDSDHDGLRLEELYGLYLSWCGLRASEPVRGRAFRAALRTAGIRPSHRSGLCPGVAMAGPAACDYIVHRELPLAVLGTGPDSHVRGLPGSAADGARSFIESVPGGPRDAAPAA